MKTASAPNYRKLGNEYQNLVRQLQVGRFVGYYRQGTKLIPKYVSWNSAQLKVREQRAQWLMRYFGQTKNMYPSDRISEPAIAAYDENGEFKYIPESKVGLSRREIYNLRRKIIG